MIGFDHAWLLLRGLAARASAGQPITDGPIGLVGDALTTASPGQLVVDPTAPRMWRTAAPPAAEVARLFDLYLPLCVGPGAPRRVVGHLAQSLDGRIATASGASQFISGAANVEHAHRMRALFDAVVVGAGTVERDDPRLTTRLVPGEHATRVVIDPRRRLAAEHAVFQDGAAPTLLLCGAPGPARLGHAEVVVLPAAGHLLLIADILAALRARGLGRIFVEGGGVTVSRFLEADALDRLQVAVAPVILGSGRPAFSLPVIDQLSEAITLDCHHVVMGPDVLFDCALPGR